jgi:two-component system OmpR family response regulator
VRPTLLVVEDEAMLLKALKRLLGQTFEVRGATCVTDALAAFDGHVDAVLTDFCMPDGDGLSLVAALRAKGFRGPIAVLSALVESKELNAALASGAVNALVLKPWASADLLDGVRRLCAAGTPSSEDSVSENPEAKNTPASRSR